MINVVENYKLLNIEIDGEIRTEKVNPTEAWNVLEFEFNGKVTTVNEGDTVEFVVETGEIKQGTLIKITGKGEKTKITIVPLNTPSEETWSVVNIQEGTFKVVNKDKVDYTEDNDYENMEY